MNVVGTIGGIVVLLLCSSSAHAQMTPRSRPAQVLEGAAIPYLEVQAADGIARMTTYRLYLELSGQVHNAYAIFGVEDTPAHFPPAFQELAPFGANTGGTIPQFWPMKPPAQYDSWLSVGVDDGSKPALLSSIGIGFEGAPWHSSNKLFLTICQQFGPGKADVSACSPLATCATAQTGTTIHR